MENNKMTYHEVLPEINTERKLLLTDILASVKGMTVQQAYNEAEKLSNVSINEALDRVKQIRKSKRLTNKVIDVIMAPFLKDFGL